MSEPPLGVVEQVASELPPPLDDYAASPSERDTVISPETELVTTDEQSTDGSPSVATPPSQTDKSGTARGLVGGGLILGLIVAVLGALMVTKALAEHSMQRYGWPMILNWWNVLHVVAVFAFYVGWMLAGPLAGAIVAVGLWLIVTFVNIRKTSLGFGLLISVVQPLVVWIVYAVVALFRNKPVNYDHRT